MKKIKNKAMKAIAMALALTSLGSIAACGGTKVNNSATTLEIFIGNFGYGYEWVEEEIKLFKEQDWVKAKYPELNIPTPQHNSERQFPTERILAGPKANAFDLLFTCGTSAASYFNTDNSLGGDGSYYEDLTTMFESNVPGENIKYKDKMLPSLYADSQTEKLDSSTAIYGTPWVNGFMGLLYNKTLMDEMLGSYEIPRTTSELSALTTAIKGKTDKKYNSLAGSKDAPTPFISSSKTNYWFDMFRIWWVQYEGFESYERYFNGVDELGGRTWENVKQMGRLRGLEALESLIGIEQGNNHASTNTMEFTTAQAKFFLREGVMMANGDWLENEMRATSAENPYDDDIRYMRLPIISSIIEKCSTIKTDEALSAVVKAIDENKSYDETKTAYASAGFGELSQSDYKKIKEARSVTLGVGGHLAHIPSYSGAKEVAKDFLLFLATDVACSKFSEVTGGVSAPFAYDLSKINPTLYNSLSGMHQSRMEIIANGVNMRPNNTFRLYYLGGLSNIAKYPAVESCFTAQNIKDRKTAQEIYDADVEYYSKNNQAEWKSVLTKAGY